jgi:hypothetical protein
MKHSVFGASVWRRGVAIGITVGLPALAQSPGASEPSSGNVPSSPSTPDSAARDSAPRDSAAPVSAPMPSPAMEATTAAPPNHVYRVENGTVVLEQQKGVKPVTTVGPAQSASYHDGKLYVTHGDTSVAVYSCTNPEAPTLEQTLHTARGIATGIAVIGGTVWVTTVSHQAVPLDELTVGTTQAQSPQSAPHSTTTAPTKPGAPISGDYAVKVVEPGVIEIAAGSQHDVRIGNRFTIYRETAVGSENNAFSGAFKGEELVALAEVVAVREDSALAELSRNAIVSERDVARVAREDQTESNIYPVRVANVGDFGGTLRPIVNAGSPLGVGALAEVFGSFWGNGYFVNLMVQPLGLGWTDKGNIVSTSALLEGGYDARAFSVGLGVGISAINGDMDSMLDSLFGAAEATLDSGEPLVVDKQETHSAFTLSQWVRLGARDGLNLSLRNLLILHKDSDTKETGFFYGGTMGKLVVPLDRRNDLFLEGGGGVMGYWLVGAGVGTWVVGNGGPGSWKLSISAGAAGIWGTKEVTTTTETYSSTYHEDVDIAGPMVSFGVSRRFAL